MIDITRTYECGMPTWSTCKVLDSLPNQPHNQNSSLRLFQISFCNIPLKTYSGQGCGNNCLFRIQQRQHGNEHVDDHVDDHVDVRNGDHVDHPIYCDVDVDDSHDSHGSGGSGMALDGVWELVPSNFEYTASNMFRDMIYDWFQSCWNEQPNWFVRAKRSNR